MVTHPLLHILHREFTVRLYIKWHRLLCRITLDEVSVLIHRRVILTEERPDTCLTAAQRSEIIRAIGLLEAEIGILSLEIALLTCKRNHIRRIETVLLIIKRNLLDARLISMCRDTIIGDADCYPDCPFTTGTFTDHLHDPSLVLISDRESLTSTVIAILSHQVCHHLNGFTSGLRTLQGNVNQATIIHDTRRITQLTTAAKRTLGDGQLMLVHIAHHVIGTFHLSDRT